MRNMDYALSNVKECFRHVGLSVLHRTIESGNRSSIRK